MGLFSITRQSAHSLWVTKRGDNTKATHCKLDDSVSSAENLCFCGAATAVIPLPLPVTPTARSRKLSDAGSKDPLGFETKHTFA